MQQFPMYSFAILPDYTDYTDHFLPAPAPNSPANPRTQLQLHAAFEDEEDDEELISAVSQYEAQLNAGVACDANANIVRMFCVI